MRRIIISLKLSFHVTNVLQSVKASWLAFMQAFIQT